MDVRNILPFVALSPSTRRRNRGRGTVVFDDLTDETTMNSTDSIINTTDITPSALVDSLLLNPTPSPDELIIQARGRRRGVPLTFSPDVHKTPIRRGLNGPAPQSGLARNSDGSAASTQQTRGISRLLLPKRTSPRKRLTLTDSPPAADANAKAVLEVMGTPSPDKGKRGSPVSKKIKRSNSMTDEPSVDPLVQMKSLNQSQLSSVIANLLNAHPELSAEVSAMLPAPDLGPMEERLLYLKRNISRSLPNTRLESKTDSLAYNRVSGHLLTFKKEVTDQSKMLLDGQQWAACLDHVLVAWSYVRATPVWDNPAHNNVRRGLFKALAANGLTAAKKGKWTPAVASELKEKLSPLEKDCDDIKSCLKQLDQTH